MGGRDSTRFSLVSLVVLSSAASCASNDYAQQSRARLGDDARIYTRRARASSDQAYARECLPVDDLDPNVPPRVDGSNGIDRCEALALANYRVGLIGCGGLGTPFDGGHEWLVPLFLGAGGTPEAPVRVDKRTGEVSQVPDLR
jgi:hypothetical protein